LLADGSTEAPLVPRDVEDSFWWCNNSPSTNLDQLEWEIMYH
jgi:hypothetical protein